MVHSMKMTPWLIVFLTAFPAAFLAPKSGYAAQNKRLSNIGIFYRCYGQLVRGRPPRNDARVLQIQDGTLDPVEACINLITKAEFADTVTASSRANLDAETKSVLRTMHDFHASWFRSQNYEGNLFSGPQFKAFENIYDPTIPAAYLTRALFNPQVKYEEVLTANQTFRPIRTDMNPIRGARSNEPKLPVYYEDVDGNNQVLPVPYAPQGEILGVGPSPSLILPKSIVTYNPGVTNHDLNKNLGTGIIGDPVYLMQTVQGFLGGFLSDGVLVMPRRWARAVYNDLLCRELPVIRRGDAAPFTSNLAQAPFRKSTSCNQCHAAMDRLASFNRAALYSLTSKRDSDENGYNIYFMYHAPVDRPAADVWPLASDIEYSRRPPEGVIYYRSFDGKLIHKRAEGLASAARIIADQEDLYVCAAKRYYEFFTGIQANINDIGDPAQPVQLDEKELASRNEVISFGRKLKSHQKLKELLRDILSSQTYQDRYFMRVDTP